MTHQALRAAPSPRAPKTPVLPPAGALPRGRRQGMALRMAPPQRGVAVAPPMRRLTSVWTVGSAREAGRLRKWIDMESTGSYFCLDVARNGDIYPAAVRPTSR